MAYIALICAGFLTRCALLSRGISPEGSGEEIPMLQMGGGGVEQSHPGVENRQLVLPLIEDARLWPIRLLPIPLWGNFKDVRFYSILNFGLFWAALLGCSCFATPEIFVSFGPTPIFQLLEALFWPKRRPKMLKFWVFAA